MTATGKTVAILAANPALTAVLGMVLAGDSRLRVRPFDREEDLIAYMDIAPVDLLVVDFDRAGRPAHELVEAMRLDPVLGKLDLPVIALTRAITPPMRQQTISAGIDEVIVKPMSPRHLLQRVRARLAHRSVVGMLGAANTRSTERRQRPALRVVPTPPPAPARRDDNVVSLFPRQARPELEPVR